jgi:hypothetical protein
MPVAQMQKYRRRVVKLWLADGIMQEIDENEWPPCTHGNDDKAAREWARITGLPVTICTEQQHTFTPSYGELD